MKKRNVVNLIRYHVEKNERAFRQEAYMIQSIFENTGDHEIAQYLTSLLANRNIELPEWQAEEHCCALTSVPTEVRDFIEVVPYGETELTLPKVIERDLSGIYHAISQEMGLHKFLFYGQTGTGKTEAAKSLARKLDLPLYLVQFPALIDCKLGQTQKNVLSLFQALGALSKEEPVLVLLDELDAFVMDRINSEDLREMGRVTSTFLRCMDTLPTNIIVLGTTNLYVSMDKALLRRFDFCLNFNRYDDEDRLRIAENLLDYYQRKMGVGAKNLRLFRKILRLLPSIPNPGDLKNMIRIALAFSQKNDDYDYLRRFYETVTERSLDDPLRLKEEGFTDREIAILLATKTRKASV